MSPAVARPVASSCGPAIRRAYRLKRLNLPLTNTAQWGTK
jgi:hypothetical protein